VALFKFCIVCDDVRIEVQNKASIIGFYGMLDYVSLSVQNPALPIAKLAFMLISADPVPQGSYGIHLSLKDPRGNELLSQVDATRSDAHAGPLNAVIACMPFPLAGVGTYQVTAIVNGKPDLSGTLKIGQAPLPN
jgi:hypothetical protein